MMQMCPCGSKKEYKDCCEPFHNKKAVPPTAESLMRARYSAYVKKEIGFIEETHSLEARDNLSVEETRKWAEESKWLGLQILGTQKGTETDQEGVVEFVASYSQKGTRHDHHEISNFIKKDGVWFYKDGNTKNTTVVRDEVKVGRNDPCPCGSGKKYKKCCSA